MIPDIPDIPDKGTIDEYNYYMTDRPSVVLAVRSKVVDELIVRNTQPDRAEIQEIAGKTRAKTNPEKWIAKERLTGLSLLRELNEGAEAEIISDAYRYNEWPGIEDAINLDSTTYGVAGTGDADYGMKARLTAGYTYTTDTYNFSDKETRNAAYESGSMNNEEGKQSTSLYEVSPISPPNEFIRFLSLEAGTPTQLLYVLHNVLTTNSYGARSTRTGKNIQNSLEAVVLSNQPAFLSAAEFLAEYAPEPDNSREMLREYIAENRRDDWTVHDDPTDFPDWLVEMQKVANRTHGDSLEVMREAFAQDTENAIENVKLEG